MRFSKEIVDKKFSEAPQIVREAVTSDDVAQQLSEIGKSHNLHIDQMGVIEEESLYVMLGVTSVDAFISNLSERLDVSSEVASKIAQEINDKVLLLIRENLRKDAENEEKAIETENPTKEDMIAEIENPTPFQHPISADRPNGPTPETALTVTHDFLAGKMNEPVSMPPQKYTADPYREPLA